MEALARKLLKRPLEITVGARSVVAEDVTQVVEVREDDTRFTRLLEILGQAYNDDAEARVLIFVSRQEAADNLLRDLNRRGYLSMSIHGGKVKPYTCARFDYFQLQFGQKSRSFNTFIAFCLSG